MGGDERAEIRPIYVPYFECCPLLAWKAATNTDADPRQFVHVLISGTGAKARSMQIDIRPGEQCTLCLHRGAKGDIVQIGADGVGDKS